MKARGVTLVLACCFAAHFALPGAHAAGSAAKQAMAVKAAEEIVAVPIQELWKDVYHNVVRVGGIKLWRKLVRMVRHRFSDRVPHSLAVFIMARLKDEVFDGQVNEKVWKRLTEELWEILHDWWCTTPEEPLQQLDVAVWNGLVKLQKTHLGPVMRGSSKNSPLAKVLFDTKLEKIRSWIELWKSEKTYLKE